MKRISPASREEDLDGLISRYRGKIDKMSDPESPPEAAIKPNKLFNPNLTDQKIAMVSSMLCKHKENKSGKDRTKANSSICPENIPPFLRNRKLLKSQLEKQDPEFFKEVLLKFRDIDKVSRIVGRCLTWLPRNRCLQLAELIPAAQNIMEIQATLQT